MPKENQRAKPVINRIAGFLWNAFHAKPVYDLRRVAEALGRYASSNSFGSVLYVDFSNIAPARKPGRPRRSPVDALRCFARAAVAGAAGVLPRSVAGGDGTRIPPSPARAMGVTVTPRRDVLAMASRRSRFFAQQVNPDWCVPSAPSCSSQILVDLTARG